MNKIYILYNLIESGESISRIEKIIYQEFTFDELLTVTEADFYKKSTYKKPELYNSVTNFAKDNKDCTLADLSIYYLIRHNISKHVIDGVFKKGLTKLFYILFFEPEVIQEEFGLKLIEISKLYSIKSKLVNLFFNDILEVDVNSIPIFKKLIINDMKKKCLELISTEKEPISKKDIYLEANDYQTKHFDVLIDEVLSELIKENLIFETSGKYYTK